MSNALKFTEKRGSIKILAQYIEAAPGGGYDYNSEEQWAEHISEFYLAPFAEDSESSSSEDLSNSFDSYCSEEMNLNEQSLSSLEKK